MVDKNEIRLSEALRAQLSTSSFVGIMKAFHLSGKYYEKTNCAGQKVKWLLYLLFALVLKWGIIQVEKIG